MKHSRSMGRPYDHFVGRHTAHKMGAKHGGLVRTCHRYRVQVMEGYVASFLESQRTGDELSSLSIDKGIAVS